jgi:hypothetical protein
MKKFLSLLTLMLLCTTAWAAEVADTLTATGIGNSGKSAYAGWTNKQFGSAAVYAGNTSGGNGASNACIQMRAKNNESGIVTTTSGGYTVKKVTVSFNTQTSSGTLQVFGKSTAYATAADLYDESTQGTLVGEITYGQSTELTFSSNDTYPYIGLRSKSGTIYIDQIVIVWDTEASTATVAAPVITFSPATAYEGDEVTCSISCATDSAVIQYSTDGETYQEYNGEFTLNATTTVYAKAMLNNEVSEIAQKTITFGKAVQNIAEFNDLEDNETFKFNGTVTVLGQKGSNLYVQDANNGMLIYGTTSQTYTFGDIIPAGFKGTKTTFNGAPEMTNPADFAAATENVKPTAIEMTIADVTLDNFGRYGVIRGATINGDSIVVGNAKVAYFNRFDVDIPTDDATYDVYGVASYYNGNQFLPLSFNKVETPVEFGIQVTPVAGEYTEPVTVEISTTGLAEGEVATITYTIGDGEQQTYTEPFTLYKSATVTVMAECGDKSDIQEYTYTINLPALAFTMTPEPGTYQGEQNVTIACTNAVSDLTVVWAYTPEGGNPIEGNETNMTFTAAKSGVLTIMAEEANTGREYNTPDEGLTYTITEPIELDGMIVFKDNENDGNQVLTAETYAGQIATGGNYVESISEVSNVYAGKTGLKFSSSKNNGSMTLNLTNTWNATKISFIAKNYGNDEATMTVGDSTFTLTADFALYELPFESAQQIDAITFAATKRAYLKVVNIEGEQVAPQPSYEIALTPAPVADKVYKAGITVTAQVTPELPEGASLKYVFAETGASEEAAEADYPEGGIKLSKSGTLTIIARDAQNAELARTSGDYNFELVGDLNGDGVVDVQDVNYLVSIILGKIRFE